MLLSENLIPCLIEKNSDKAQPSAQINTRLTFAEDAFTPEQLALVPQLGKEFILDSKLSNFANSLTTGAIRSVLFYGPAGTGKSMTCKLLAFADSFCNSKEEMQSQHFLQGRLQRLNRCRDRLLQLLAQAPNLLLSEPAP